MIETWYVLDDGTVADPRDVSAGADGRLRHKDGRAVAYAPHGPRTRSIDADAERAKYTQPDVPRRPYRSRDMKPEETVPTYKTRSIKGE